MFPESSLDEEEKSEDEEEGQCNVSITKEGKHISINCVHFMKMKIIIKYCFPLYNGDNLLVWIKKILKNPNPQAFHVFLILNIAFV